MLTNNSISTSKTFSPVGILVAVVMSLLLASCGSTKVYTAEKTMVYKGNLYNLGQVQQIGSSMKAELPTGESLDTSAMDSKAIKSLLKEHDAFTFTSTLLLDEKEIVYERVKVDSYSDYSKHQKRFDKARKELTKFMSDAKSTQLKLD